MKRAVLVVCDSEPESEYKKVSADAFSKATSLLVGSTQDLLTRKPDNHLLHTWMNIIAHGKTVQTRDNPAKPCVYAAASKIVPVAVNFDNEFTKKHNKLVAAFRSIAKTKDSRWREATAGQKTSVNIARAEDLRRLLVSLQRFPVIAGLECKYSSSKATVTRFGRRIGAVGPRPLQDGGMSWTTCASGQRSCVQPFPKLKVAMQWGTCRLAGPLPSGGVVEDLVTAPSAVQIATDMDGVLPRFAAHMRKHSHYPRASPPNRAARTMLPLPRRTAMSCRTRARRRHSQRSACRRVWAMLVARPWIFVTQLFDLRGTVCMRCGS